MDIPELVDNLLCCFNNHQRRESAASTRRLDSAIREVLKVMLGRNPTREEIERACK